MDNHLVREQRCCPGADAGRGKNRAGGKTICIHALHLGHHLCGSPGSSFHVSLDCFHCQSEYSVAEGIKPGAGETPKGKGWGRVSKLSQPLRTAVVTSNTSQFTHPSPGCSLARVAAAATPAPASTLKCGGIIRMPMLALETFGSGSRCNCSSTRLLRFIVER